MSRPLVISTIFGLCVLVVLAGAGWMTALALRADRAELEARRQALLEENVRLALWRLDSALAPLLATESTRPYFAYSAFYPANRVYTQMFAAIESGELLVASPLLGFSSPYIRLHFQYGPDGELSSPQVPQSRLRSLAPAVQTVSAAAQPRLAELSQLVNADDLAHALAARDATPAGRGPSPIVAIAPSESQMAIQQRARGISEFQRRASNLTQAILSNAYLQKGSEQSVAATPMTPLWVGETLLLVRRVTVGSNTYLQGCWLDWPAIQQWLLGEIEDLFPDAKLIPARSTVPKAEQRMLAALPMQLVPGEHFPEALDGLSSIRLSVLFTWICVLSGIVAAAVLLRATVQLSERRQAFVSAVTHELRTPLTTLRMYTEMLRDGMVTDEQQRQRYLQTLSREADRLGELVENVLAYARLERGRATRPRERLTVAELLNRFEERLTQRADQAGMTLVILPDRSAGMNDPAHLAMLHTEPGAVEQILLNLVDNACKYAAAASNKTIQLALARGGKHLLFRVRDYGPGISSREARHLFQPFCKSARRAAETAPGVGLGLALSRQLARHLCGELCLDTSVSEGACFILRLPVTDS